MSNDSDQPVKVKGISSAASLSSDGGGYCAVLTSQDAECWGVGNNGELGNGSKKASDIPVPVSGLTGIVSMPEASYDDHCAVLSSGGVDCWGNGNNGQLGDGSLKNSDVPVPVIIEGQVAPPTITSFSPTSGKPGAAVTIKGTNLSGATNVSFNGVSAAISKDTASTLKVTVPAGAISGKIEVTTPGGSVKSSTKFTVT